MIDNTSGAALAPPCTRRLRLSLVAAACAGLLGSAASAQTAPAADQKLDTVTVTGFRASLESSISTKRNADAIVEAISAEDIGKLPDVSIADAISRLPGLTSQRVNGRSSVISIRGMAPRYGVTITGTNTTTEQVAAVAENIRRENLGDRLNVIEADFREPRGEFDKVVSIGVLEHAGRDQLDEVVKAHADALKPGGLGMLHFIGHVGRRDTEYFIREHVFPGGWIPSLADVIVAMEEAGLEVVDIENLRRHYALTLDVWAERFDRNWSQIQVLDPTRFNERFRRIWRTYLIGCAEMFRSPHEQTHLFQITFSKGNVTSTSYPMTRDFLYAGGKAPLP